MSQLPTNPILPAPANAHITCFADRRISAGFIVEAALGASVLHASLHTHVTLTTMCTPPPNIIALDTSPVISTLWRAVSLLAVTFKPRSLPCCQRGYL
jgi:hypothetical protein